MQEMSVAVCKNTKLALTSKRERERETEQQWLSEKVKTEIQILPQCSSSLLSPQSSSWSHLKARGMQDPEATQRNWLDGSQVVVAEEKTQTRTTECLKFFT